jgi:hypothetical protein
MMLPNGIQTRYQQHALTEKLPQIAGDIDGPRVNVISINLHLVTDCAISLWAIEMSTEAE